MQTIGLFPNMKKPSVNTVLGWMIQYLKERQVDVLLPDNIAVETDNAHLACDLKTMKDRITVAITLGGDGTLLNTAREIAPAGIPICGVNLGRVGFLTEIELPELSAALEKILVGDYFIEERLMLDAVVIRDGSEIYISSALNDIVITKGGFSRMVRLKLFIEGEYTVHYSADGLIFATSTGSTGYSLSAGGPIVNPSLKVITITPICPHTLQARSLIVSEDDEIQVKMQATHNDIMLTVDGQTVYSLQPEDQVLVRRSAGRANFIRFDGKSFYEKLRLKLRRSDRDANF